MALLYIEDPKKRDMLVEKLLRDRKTIQQSILAQRVGDIEMFREAEKLFKPITMGQKEISEKIETLPVAITNSFQPLTYLAQPAIEQSPAESKAINLGPIATEYLQKYVGRSGGDTTFGIYNKGGKFTIGNMPVQFENNDLIIGDSRYTGTPGLWELIVNKNPTQYTDDDKNVYEDILVKTNAMHHDNDPNNPRPKSSKGDKYLNIIKPIWGKMKGSGIKSTGSAVVIPSDPNALLKRLDILMASTEAGHTGVKNEIVSIKDELLRQGILSKDQYKNI
jgi:hypothetical protein